MLSNPDVQVRMTLLHTFVLINLRYAHDHCVSPLSLAVRIDRLDVRPPRLVRPMRCAVPMLFPHFVD
jgi:hypothetical protein